MAKFLDAAGTVVAVVPDEKCKVKTPGFEKPQFANKVVLGGVEYKGMGYVVPPEDRDGSLRFFLYQVPPPVQSEEIVELDLEAEAPSLQPVAPPVQEQEPKHLPEEPKHLPEKK